MRVGIAGFGHIGRAHHAGFARLPGVEVTVVASHHDGPEGAEVVPDAYDLVTDDRVDAVVIALPTPDHVPLAVACLRAGKPVLVEKPVALSVAAASELVAVAQATGVVAQMAHVVRHMAQPRLVHDLLGEGRSGRPIDVTIERLSTMPRWSSWLGDLDRSGGVLFDLMIHDLDFCRWTFGEPQGLRALDRVTHARVELDYGDFTATLTASWAMPADYPFTWTLRAVSAGAAVEATPGRTRGYGDVATTVEHGPDDPFRTQAAAFVEAVRRGAPSEGLGVADGLAAVALAQAAHEDQR